MSRHPSSEAVSWTRSAIARQLDRPLLELVFEAATVHRRYHDSREVQVSSLISIKAGGCPEDCSYCPQAARYQTGVKRHGLLAVDDVLEHARKAKKGGASRICMGAAWREVREGKDFDQVVKTVTAVKDMGMEVCCTLGMLTDEQAQRLKDAGLFAYNHNIDTSPEYYGDVISTRGFDDRLQTLGSVRKAGLTVCSGGIIGMGESREDRAGMLAVLAALDPPPESVPINALVPVAGTPYGEREKIDGLELVRMIATARIVLPKARVRLSAGRKDLSEAEQAMCFLAGANSIFAGEKLLTTPNPEFADDLRLFDKLGLRAAAAYSQPGLAAEQIPHSQAAATGTAGEAPSP